MKKHGCYKYGTWNFYRGSMLLFLAVLSASNALAGESQWELGVGVTAMNIPFYPGSSQSKTYLFPIPHILYRSEKLKIDNGIDATLLRTSRTRFNISADFAVPVNSSDD